MTIVEKEILLERRRFAAHVFALSASLVLLVLAVAQGALFFGGLHTLAPGQNEAILALQRSWWQVLAVCGFAFVVAGWKTYQAWKDSAGRIGRLIDEKLAASKNRLEASVALSHSADPVAQAQRRETAEYLARKPVRQRTYVLALALACGAALLILNGTIATQFAYLVRSSQLMAQAAIKKPDLPKVAEPPPYAKIDIVAPQSDIRATPIEEVVVKGDADSDHGFSAVVMKASLNGAAEKSFSIDPALFTKGGEIKFDQSLLLDELGAEPYDVVGYYLEGTSRHEKPLHVSSQMQFIEVRPFREDVHKVSAMNGNSQCFAKLTWLISQQMIISKRTWIIASDQLPANNPSVAAETGKTGDQQDKIAGKTHELYQTMTEGGFPASIIDHVSQAETSMHQAVAQIRIPALRAANPIQEHALGELVAATKAFVKVLAQNPAKGSNPNQVRNPFKDKQKFPAPTGPPATNPMVKLNKLIKREQDIVKNLSAPSDKDQPKENGNPPSDEKSKTETAQNPPGQTPASSPQDSPSDSPSPSPSPEKGQQTAQNPSPSPDGGKSEGSPQGGPQMAQEQAQIGSELGDMQSQSDTPPSSNSEMAEAQQAAQSSADKLAAENKPGALNDARAAEAAMLRAETAMSAEAGQQMRDALAEAQQQLQDAAQMERDATGPTDQAQAKEQAETARDSLAREQDHQAAVGDPKLVQLVNRLVKQYDQSEIPQKLAQLANQPIPHAEDRAAAAEALRKLADQLSAERLAMQTETQNLQDTLHRIDRIQHNMNASRGSLEQQAQMAHELQGDLKTALSDAKALLPPGSQPGQSASGSAGGNSGEDAGEGTTDGKIDHGLIRAPIHPVSTAAFQGLREPLAALRVEVEQRLEYLRNQSVLTYLNPDQSPEEYRAQVAAYYERISREAKASAPNPSGQPPSPSP